MKYCYLTLVLLFFSRLNAQQITYQPYHEGTTMWLHNRMVADGLGGVISTDFRTIWSGDTVINAEHYTRIYRSAGTDPSNPMTYLGGIRQDIPNQKVYFVNTAEQEFDISISHFLEVGDSIPVTPELNYALFVNSNFEIYNADWLVVYAKDSVQINPSEYRVLYEFYEAPFAPIPGIYYTGGRGFDSYSGFEHGWSTLCYKEEDSVIYGASQAPWYYSCVASVQEEEEINVTISPNPSSGKYHLAIDNNESFNYEVVDIYGKRIVSLTYNPELDLTAFPSGIYFVCVFNLAGTERIYRVVKE
ncbi:MAG: T9SS type A sorting domain-containing protein [Bacteroidota bacterium]